MKKYINIKSFLSYFLILNLLLTNNSFAMESDKVTNEKLKNKVTKNENAPQKNKIPKKETIDSLDKININKESILNDAPQKNEETKDIQETIKEENIATTKTVTPKEKESTEEVTIEELADEEDEEDSKEPQIDVSKLTDSEIKALGHQLRTASKEKQKTSLKTLKMLKNKAKPATSEILASLHEKKTGNEAVDILISINTPTAISGLAKLVSNSDLKLSNYILENIVKLKSNAEFIIEELIANFQNQSLKKNIINALGEIQGDRAFYELKELLKSQTEQEEIKILVLQNFTKFKNAKNELPLLRKLYRQNAPSDYADELYKVIEQFEKN